MAETLHHVRQQTLLVTVDSEPSALDLRPRIEALNRDAFLDVLERVFEEFATPGTHIRIDRLDLDLGNIAAADIERVAPARLERVLREQLQLLVQRARQAATDSTAIHSSQTAKLDAVEHYLVSGVLPFWTRS